MAIFSGSEHLAPSASVWQCGRFSLVLNRPLVMGILNLTPDSFSDGGAFVSPDLAIERAHSLIAQGADIIDIGGESTRPNAPAVSCCEELTRILPVIDALIDCGVPISVDTRKPYVMREVLKLGVDIINDVAGFTSPVAIDAVADSHCGLCVMHMQGEPQTMQIAPHYTNVVDEVAAYLRVQCQRLQSAGVAQERICLDPGIGFGKTLAHNRSILQALSSQAFGTAYPILLGISRKRMLGEIVSRAEGVLNAPHQRLAASVSAAIWAVTHGAHIVRVHDVQETVDALAVWRFLQFDDAWLPPN